MKRARRQERRAFAWPARKNETPLRATPSDREREGPGPWVRGERREEFWPDQGRNQGQQRPAYQDRNPNLSGPGRWPGFASGPVVFQTRKSAPWPASTSNENSPVRVVYQS